MSGLESTRTSLGHPGRNIGRYEIRGQIGRGGFGAVYRAFDPQLQREVALKILMRASPKARQRFTREVQAVARLRHPNVVAIHDSGEEGGRPYLVMEFVDGHTYEQLVRDDRLSLRERVEITRDVARAIQYAHDQGVLHRDLKPENVLVDQEQQAQVLDFGLAYLEEESGLQRLSISGIPMGTPAYMAPEQASGRRPGKQTDVWGLGGILYFGLVGEGPYERYNNPLIAVQNEPVTPPREAHPEVPVALERICMRCLSKVADDRYASANEVAEALTTYLERGDSVLQMPTGRAAQAAMGGVGLLLAVAVGLLAFALARSQPPPTPAPSPNPTEVATSPTPPPAETSPQATQTPLTPQAQEVHRTLEKARELGARLLGSELVVAELRQAARQAKGDRALEERVALAIVGHHLRRAELDEAIAVLETHPWQTEVPADRLRLSVYVAMEDEEKAKRLLPRLSQGDPTSVGAVVASGWLQLLEEQDVDAALYTGRRAVEIAPEDTQALLFVAHVYTLREDLRRAIEYLERARQVAPDDYRVHELLAVLLQEDGEPKAARSAFDDLIHIKGDRAGPDAFAARGMVRSRIGDIEGALADLKKALELEPTNFNANMSLGVYYVQYGAPEKAREHLLLALDQEPGVFKRHLESLPGQLRGEIASLLEFELDLPEDLLAWLRDRTEAVERPARAAVHHALQLAARGEPWEEIAAALDEAQRASPESAAVALERARLSCRRDAFDFASRALARARSLGADPVELDLLQAELLGRQGKFDEAATLYEQVARSAGDTPLGLTAAATKALLEDDFEAAISLAQASLEKDVRQPACRVIEVLCLAQLGEAETARRHAESSVFAYGSIDSRLVLSSYRAWLDEKTARLGPGGRLPEGDVLEILSRAESLRSSTESVLPQLTAAAFLLNHPATPGAADHAARLLTEARDREPERGSAYLQTARLFIVGGKRDQAIAALIRSHELGIHKLPVLIAFEFERAFGRSKVLARIFPSE